MVKASAAAKENCTYLCMNTYVCALYVVYLQRSPEAQPFVKCCCSTGIVKCLVSNFPKFLQSVMSYSCGGFLGFALQLHCHWCSPGFHGALLSLHLKTCCLAIQAPVLGSCKQSEATIQSFVRTKYIGTYTYIIRTFMDRYIHMYLHYTHIYR